MLLEMSDGSPLHLRGKAATTVAERMIADGLAVCITEVLCVRQCELEDGETVFEEGCSIRIDDDEEIEQAALRLLAHRDGDGRPCFVNANSARCGKHVVMTPDGPMTIN